ncbi:MAG: hypothetical protein ACRYGK_00520 [Janthinobacterium lividum]
MSTPLSASPRSSALPAAEVAAFDQIADPASRLDGADTVVKRKNQITTLHNSILSRFGSVLGQFASGAAMTSHGPSWNGLPDSQRDGALTFARVCQEAWQIKGDYLPSGRLDDKPKTVAVSVAEVRAAKAEQLIAGALGKTIAPAQAVALKNSVCTDHTGRILGTRPNSTISAAEVSMIHQLHIIQDLGKTNTPGERSVARTDREILLECISILRSASLADPDNAELTGLAEQFKALWLGAKIGTPAVASEMIQCAHTLMANSPALAKRILACAFEALEARHDTQRLDNTFGRRFESELVHALVQAPPPGVVKAAGQFADYLTTVALDHFEFLAQRGVDMDKFHRELVEQVMVEKWPWHAELPQVAAYLQAPSAASLCSLMENPQSSGYGVILQAQLSLNLALSLPRLDWRKMADSHYNEVVNPARSRFPSALKAAMDKPAGAVPQSMPDVTTRSFGPLLVHQLPNEVPAQWTAETAVQSTYRLNFALSTQFEKNLLAREQSTVCGVSGTANLLTFMFRHMSERSQTEAPLADFNISDAFCAVMMFVTFAGGHTLPESIATFRSIMERDAADAAVNAGAPAEARQAHWRDVGRHQLAQFALDYGQLADLFSNPETSAAVKNAGDVAFEKTLEMFDGLRLQRMGVQEPSQ